MKRKVLGIVGFASFILVLGFLSLHFKQEASAITPNCPNGCLDKCGSCVCGEWYPYEEASPGQIVAPGGK